LLHEYDRPTPLQAGIRYKEEGNKAFKECDYGQASVHYTQAVETYLSIKEETLKSSDENVLSEYKELLSAAYSNRAACLLKLGDHMNALAHTNACLEINPNHVKSISEKGLH